MSVLFWALCTPSDSAIFWVLHWSTFMPICMKTVLTERAVPRTTVYEPDSPSSLRTLKEGPPPASGQVSGNFEYLNVCTLALNVSFTPWPCARKLRSVYGL